MKETIKQLEQIIALYKPQLEQMENTSFASKPYPDKWSKKQELGHLIDSAQNNIRRFVVGQYEEQPYIVYDHDQWVVISDYQHYNDKDLIDLWALINKHICIILNNTPPEAGKRLVKSQELHSIEWLAADYNKHLLHHLHHLLELDHIAYP